MPLSCLVLHFDIWHALVLESCAGLSGSGWKLFLDELYLKQGHPSVDTHPLRSLTFKQFARILKLNLSLSFSWVMQAMVSLATYLPVLPALLPHRQPALDPRLALQAVAAHPHLLELPHLLPQVWLW